MNPLFTQWIPLIVLGFNAAMFVVIKFNDMHHIGKSLINLEKKLDKVEEKLISNGERISKIEGKCAVNHANSTK